MRLARELRAAAVHHDQDHVHKAEREHGKERGRLNGLS